LEHYIGHEIVELYLVAFVAVDVHVDLEGEDDGVDEEGEEEYEQQNVYRTDGFWDEVLSDDSDASESDGDGHTGVGLDSDEGGEAELGGDKGFGVEEEDGVDLEVGRAEVGVDQGFEHEAVEDGNERGEDGSYSENKSGVLVSPTPSDEEDADEVESKKWVCVQKRVPFSAEDMLNPTLVPGNTFNDVYGFRKAIKQANVLKGKDLVYQKNSRKKPIAVCADKKCKYRVYGRQLKDEATFMMISLKPKHTCARRYKNHLITSNWIAEWCMDSFRDQPNMPIDVLKKKVKKKWNVDVHDSSLYRARKKAQESIFGKLGEQYYRLWDYCATIRSTNVRSCVILMVERPMPEVSCRFQRMYVSLTVMKKGFNDGCRPVIGLDACFLKGVYKGQLMTAIRKDANNNMYPISIAAIEAKIKDSWTWFLEALLGYLGRSPHGWTFISDRQKVISSPLFFVYNFI